MFTNDSTEESGKTVVVKQLRDRLSSTSDDIYAKITNRDGRTKQNMNVTGAVRESNEESGLPSFSADDLQPLMSPAYEEPPILNILPSYQLYSSTFCKSVQPSNEDMGQDPPTYDIASQPGVSTDGATLHFPPIDSIPSESSQSQWNPRESPRWEDSILGSSHKLKKLTDMNPSFNDKLRIDITLTEAPGRKGVVPKVLDPSFCEFQQGDSINGFVCIENLSNTQLNFDMISVVFEGKVTIMGDSGGVKTPAVFYKFLNMFEYKASWTPAYIEDEYDNDAIDDVDNTVLRYETDKIFKPHVVYKKFFTFKIPEKLLDCACQDHNLMRHCELPPSIGLARDEFLKNLRKNRSKNLSQSPSVSPSKQKQKPGKDNFIHTRIRDFSFPDAAIAYSVEVRVVGKASDYSSYMTKQPFNEKGEEFIIILDSSQFIRIQPRERLAFEHNEEQLDQQSRLIYQSLVRSIKQKIDLGRDLMDHKSCDSTENTIELSKTSSIAKRHQLYDPSRSRNVRNSASSKDDFYEVYTPYNKKILGAKSKILGTLGLIAPKLTYVVSYTPPKNYRTYSTTQRLTSSDIVVPIELTCTINKEAGKYVQPPSLKSISAELIIVSYRSKRYPIPIELTNDMFFKNNSKANDNIEGHLIEPFKKYVAELTSLTKSLTPSVLNVDSQLFMDMKTLANLSVKTNALKIDNPKVIHIDKDTEWSYDAADATNNQESFTRDLKLSIDFKQFMRKASTGVEEAGPYCACLVPNFQSCFMGRLYFVDVIVKFHNNDSLRMKLPVNIQL